MNLVVPIHRAPQKLWHPRVKTIEPPAAGSPEWRTAFNVQPRLATDAARGRASWPPGLYA
jgi:hypothetical protein